jgi:hypothetical protein
MNLLTLFHGADILSRLSQKTKAGIETPRKGHNRPLSNVVFLCPSKTQAVSCRVSSVMVGCIEQPLKRLAGSFAGSLNLIHPSARRLRPMGGGLSLHKGVTAMRNYAQNPAKSSHDPAKTNSKKSLFNLIKATPQGKKIICQDLTFDQAAELLNEIPNALIKFSRMGALS